MATRTRKAAAPKARKPAKKQPAKKAAAKRTAPAKKVAKPVKAAPAPAKRGRGRPPKYDPKFVPIVARFCEKAGATDMEIADLLGVDVRTVYRWKSDHPDFCQALKLHKATADDRVETSLYKSATGYEVDETDIRVINGKIVKTIVRRHYPPVPTSMIFWLANRKSASWRRQPEPTDGGDDAPPPVKVEVQVVDARKPGSAPA
jgi:hypothetical protein